MTISKESSDNNEVFLGAQHLIFSDQPLIVGNGCEVLAEYNSQGSLHTSGVPRWVDDRGGLGITKGLVCNVCIWDGLPVLEFPISELESLNACHVSSVVDNQKRERMLFLYELCFHTVGDTLM